MLRYLLKWKTYRTFKNGFLLDYGIKKLIYLCSKYFFYTFTIFFGDKYFLEYFFSFFKKSLTTFTVFVKSFNRESFLKFFRVTMFITSYILLLLFIMYV